MGYAGAMDPIPIEQSLASRLQPSPAVDLAARPPKRGVVGVIFQGGKFLVIRRSQHVRSPGMYCFPGGGIEAAESEHQAVCRELLEELSIRVQPMRRLWESTSPTLHLAWWLVELPVEAAICPDPLEVESYQWLTPAETAALPNLLASNHAFLAFWQSAARIVSEGGISC
jgi:8-oxo-dGTP diphosphatase